MKKLYSIVVAFLMFFNLSLFAQDGPPWDFNGTDHGFVAQNYASLTVGDTYVTFTLMMLMEMEMQNHQTQILEI